MKRTLILITGLVLLSITSTFAQSENKIMHVLDKQMKAWNEGNIEEYMQGYWKNDSLKFIGKKGISYGWNNTLQNYKSSYPGKAAMGKLTFKIITLEKLSRKNAYVIGKWSLD